MNKKQIYKRLKNGKVIETFYRKPNDVVYTIRVSLKEEKFLVHTYSLEGNDVFNESNYKNESITIFEDFERLIETMETEYPRLTFNL